ncbi:MAG: flagellar biosynthesis anti-sigma factor FlgM [Methylomonas sp.]|jgi:negative regulator of flagellin synthesis FlgM|nr:MAG: flagellar biosynthesis anti-sigma factor FlgM [Methylomonas sp.]
MAIHSINNVNTSNVATQNKSVNKSSVETNKQPNSVASGEDTINISAAQDIQKALDVSLSTPVINESRVAEIKAAVNAGTYQIDPARVADKMMQLETKIANST